MTIDLNGRTVRNVKTIDGTIESIQRFDARSNKLIGEHQSKIEVNSKGDVNVITFRIIGKQNARPLSYVFKIEEDTLYEITGILSEDKYENNSKLVRIFRWKRSGAGQEERRTTR